MLWEGISQEVEYSIKRSVYGG